MDPYNRVDNCNVTKMSSRSRNVYRFISVLQVVSEHPPTRENNPEFHVTWVKRLYRQIPI